MSSHEFDAPTALAPLRQVEAPSTRKGDCVDEQSPGGNPTSTRCRFCGCNENESEHAVRDKDHIQVVIACGSCGHPFAILSRN
jgi:hypothetical protein